MSRKAIKSGPCRTTVARLGAMGIALCCISGMTDVQIALQSVATLHAQETSEETLQDPVVFFSLKTGAKVAPLLAGPSTKYYQSGVLPPDSTVEVYFRTDDGFCAVRPPQDAFSWISGKFVTLDSDVSGRVTSPSGKSVPVRVGGESPATSSVVQVGLKPDQRVKITGETTLSDGSIWYKIAPPPGEFRWLHESSLVQTPAIAKLPSRLTFQSEYLESMRSPRSVVAGTPTQSPQGMPTQYAQGSVETTSESNVYSRRQFQSELAGLNADVFSALQKTNVDRRELSALQARAEKLFDSAPGDDDRYLVQSTFDAITKAQIALQKNPSANQLPSLNAGQTSYGLYAYSPSVMPQPAEFGSQIVGSGFDPALFNGQNSMGQPIMIDGQYILGATLVDDSTADNSTESTSSKPRPAFAFSGSNNPFRSRKNSRTAPKTESRISRMESSFSHLPGVNQEQPIQIVPPQNYNTSRTTRNTNTLAGLTPGPLRGEKAAIPASPQPSLGAQAGRLEFRAPQLAAGDSLVKPNAVIGKDNLWNPAGSTQKESSPVLPASGETRKGESKIRPTSSFAPVTSRSFNHDEPSGTLIELSDAPKGAPRYALLDKSDDAFEIVAWLDPDKNVSLDKFVGQKVVVKGSEGSVTVGDKTRRYIVVSSLFLVK